MLLRSTTIADEECSHVGTMSGIERVLGVSAFAKIAKSQVWDKRLYKNRAASGEF